MPSYQPPSVTGTDLKKAGLLPDKILGTDAATSTSGTPVMAATPLSTLDIVLSGTTLSAPNNIPIVLTKSIQKQLNDLTLGLDKNYTQAFVLQTNLLINHNLNKYPNVQVIESGGSIVEVDISHFNLNVLQISWNTPFSGTVICN